jgi:cytochrome P450
VGPNEVDTAKASDESGALTEDEVVSMCMLLLIAGHETTRSLIGAGVLALLSHPAELEALRSAPELTEQAVEEILRFDPPVQMLTRFALRDTEVSGVAVPAGSFALMLVGAANRDEAVCPDPDSFRVTRRPGRQLAFGHGIHFCLGAPLARLEASVALRLLLPELPGLRVAADPEWRPNTVLRGLEHLILEPVP